MEQKEGGKEERLVRRIRQKKEIPYRERAMPSTLDRFRVSESIGS